MGYMGYRSRGGAFEVKVIRVQLQLVFQYAVCLPINGALINASFNHVVLAIMEL